MNKKLLFTFIVAIFFLGLFAQSVDAAIFDSFNAASAKYFGTDGKVSNFIEKYLKGPRLVNYAVVGIIFILLGGFWLEKGKEKSVDGNTKYFYYALFFILAIIVVVQMTSPTEYIWKKPFVQDGKEYLFGGSSCTLGEEGFWTDSVTLAHGYTRTIGDKTFCKHPILRIGEQGRGLPVLIIVFLITLFVLKKYAKQLSLDDLNQSGFNTDKLLYYGLSFLLASTIATSGHAKDSVLRFGGWIIVMLLYGTFSERQQQGNEKSWLAMGLSFAIVETILNLMNSSLYRSFDGAVTTGTILVNFGLGVGVLFLWKFTQPKVGDFFENAKYLSEKEKDSIREKIDKGTVKTRWELIQQMLGSDVEKIRRDKARKEYEKEIEEKKKQIAADEKVADAIDDVDEWDSEVDIE